MNDQIPENTIQGSQTENEAMPQAGIGKKKSIVPIIIIGVAVTVVLAVMSLFLVAFLSSGVMAKNPEAKLKLGDKYLTDMEYEKAILAYEEAINIDPKCEDAYLNMADAYEGLANECLQAGDYDGADEYMAKAIKVLKTGYSNTSSEIIKERIEWMKQRREAMKRDAGVEALLLDETKDPINVKIISTDVSDYPTVRLYIDVLDNNGNQIELDAPLIRVQELKGGAYLEREVKRLERMEGHEGLSIELVADKSGSMDGIMWRVQDIMSEFVNHLDYASGDAVELISFDSYVMYMCTRTDDVDFLNNGIYNMVPTGSTAMYDALVEAVTSAGYQNGAKCVIAFTDGEDNDSVYTYNDVISLAQRLGIPIYIIGTEKSMESTLQSIANSTNGHYWYIDDLTNMEDLLNEIYREQKDMYVLEYYCDEADFGQYDGREISIAVGDDTYVGEITESFTPVEVQEKVQHTSRYELVKAELSWREANAAAMQKGGHLATITSQAEMDQLCAMADAQKLEFIWIGGYTSVSGNQAFGHWVTGEPFNYTAWFKGEPSRDDQDGTPEMYLMLWKIKNEWSWNDQRNDPIGELNFFRGKAGYIIEYEDAQ